MGRRLQRVPVRLHAGRQARAGAERAHDAGVRAHPRLRHQVLQAHRGGQGRRVLHRGELHRQRDGAGRRGAPVHRVRRPRRQGATRSAVACHSPHLAAARVEQARATFYGNHLLNSVPALPPKGSAWLVDQTTPEFCEERYGNRRLAWGTRTHSRAARPRTRARYCSRGLLEAYIRRLVRARSPLPWPGFALDIAARRCCRSPCPECPSTRTS